MSVLFHFTEGVWAINTPDEVAGHAETPATISVLTDEDVQNIPHLDHEDIARIATSREHVPFDTLFKLARFIAECGIADTRYRDLDPNVKDAVGSAKDFEAIQKLVVMLKGER